MHILDRYPETLLRDDRDDDYSFDLYDENESVSLEDLLHLVQEQNETDDELEMRTANFSSDGEALVWSLSVICETKLGRDMAFDARFEDWSIEVDDIEDGHHIINPQLRILILPRFAPSALALARSQNDRTKFLLEMARGLRSIWHDMTGVRENAELTVDDQILWERLRRMDQDLCALKMAWDLREQGMGGIWRHIIASSLGDVAILASEIWEDFGGTSDVPELDTFARLAPEWLSDATLLGEVDSYTCDILDARMQKSLREVCGVQQLTPKDLYTLSVLPGDSSYLAPVARTILYAPEFRSVPDPVNEAHIRQILEECEVLRSSPLVFSDSELEKKIFPFRQLDTLA